MDCLLFVGRSLRGASPTDGEKSPENFWLEILGKNVNGKKLGGGKYDLLVFFCLFVCVFFGYGCDFEDSTGFITMFVSPLLFGIGYVWIFFHPHIKGKSKDG